MSSKNKKFSTIKTRTILKILHPPMIIQLGKLLEVETKFESPDTNLHRIGRLYVPHETVFFHHDISERPS